MLLYNSPTCYFSLLLHETKSLTLADIGECTEEDAICGPHCNCTNSIGSYFCDCIKGYRLDNFDVIASASNPCTGARPLGHTCTSMTWFDRSIWPTLKKTVSSRGFFSHRYWRVLRATGHLWPQHCVHQYPRNLLLLLSWWILSLHWNLLDSWNVVLRKWAKLGLKIKHLVWVNVVDYHFRCAFLIIFFF